MIDLNGLYEQYCNADRQMLSAILLDLSAERIEELREIRAAALRRYRQEQAPVARDQRRKAA